MLDDTQITAIEAAARSVAEAEAEVARLKPASDAAEAEMLSIVEKLMALEKRRLAIRDRRASGQCSTKDMARDAGEVLIIAMDVETLTEYRERAAATYLVAHQALNDAATAVMTARKNLARVHKTVAWKALQARTVELIGLAAAAQDAAATALAEMTLDDVQDARDCRVAVAETAKAAEKVMQHAVVSIRAFDDRLYGVGLSPGRILFHPSDTLYNTILYLRLNSGAG